MTATQIHHIYKDILRAISHKKIAEALDKLTFLCQECTNLQFSDKLNHIKESYSFLLTYFVKGTDDPAREDIYKKIIADIFVLNCQLREELLGINSNNFEFSQMRYFTLNKEFTKDELLQNFNRNLLLNDADITLPKEEQNQIRKDFDASVRYLFHYFWLTNDDIENSETSVYKEVMSDKFSQSSVKAMLVSALTFNLWRTFDKQKMTLLIDACHSADLQTSQRALVGLVFVLAKYNAFIPYFPTINSRLIALIDDKNLAERFEDIFYQIIRTTETEEIAKKLQQEILPELMKMQEGNIDDILNISEWEELNPAWKKITKDEKVIGKMEELTELEKSGSDIYMGTFANMKFHPFFNEISNWFLPFDTNHSQISELFQESEKSIFSVFLNSPVMCNSDKYSFSLNMYSMPESQKNMMKQNFGEVSEHLKEAQKEQLLSNDNNKDKTISKHYIQDLFRFFKLNPKRKDFTDMFSITLFLHKTYLFDLLAENNVLKEKIAEFYFSKKLYKQALELYEELDKSAQQDAGFYQRMGYCYQQITRLEKALEVYQKADLIQSDDFWTVRKIAMCYRLLNQNEKAILSYRQLKKMKPNNITVRLQLVDSLVQENREKEALQELNQLNEEYPNHAKIIRQIIKVALLDKNIAQANYFQSVLEEQEEMVAEDELIAGHIGWIMNKSELAMEHYRKAFEKIEKKSADFDKIFDKNSDLLLKNGVEKQEILWLKDAVLLIK